MSEQNQNNVNQIKKESGYNSCPKCGRQAYALHTEDGMYSVGCLHCGLKNGVFTLFDEVTQEDVENKMRITWNEKCLKNEYEEDALKAMNLANGGYVIVSNVDGQIVHITEDFSGVEAYLTVVGDSLSFDIYLMNGRRLQHLGSTFLLWLIKQNHPKLSLV